MNKPSDHLVNNRKILLFLSRLWEHKQVMYLVRMVLRWSVLGIMDRAKTCKLSSIITYMRHASAILARLCLADVLFNKRVF